jgi:hypothetical protein
MGAYTRCGASYHSVSHTFLRSLSASDSLPGLFAYESKDVVLRPQEKSQQSVQKGDSLNGTENVCRRKRFVPFRLSRLSIFSLHLIISGEL